MLSPKRMSYAVPKYSDFIKIIHILSNIRKLTKKRFQL
ncbi:hypothetical protein PcP3B5_25500 [Pseudomonas citronellolis]|nr:hypothetical protein PcP3B5_25500 [Pseudomonas citronellolis]